MFFSYANFQRSQKRHCYQLHWDTLFQESFWSRSINSRVGFYRSIKPLGFVSWLYTPIKPSRPFTKHYIYSFSRVIDSFPECLFRFPGRIKSLTDHSWRKVHKKTIDTLSGLVHAKPFEEFMNYRSRGGHYPVEHLLSHKFPLPCGKTSTIYHPRPSLPTFSLMFIVPMVDGGVDSSASSTTASDTRMSTDNVPVDNRDVSYCRYMFYSTFF